MTPPSARHLLQSLLPGRGPPRAPDGPAPQYTVVFPPTMLWANYQRPHNVLAHLARHHEVRCLFNDWTVREQIFEDGRLIVTKKAFRSRLHHRPLIYYYSVPEKLDYLARHRLRPDLIVFELMDIPEAEFEGWKVKLPRSLTTADIVRTTDPAITEYLLRSYPDELADMTVTTSRNGVDLSLFDPERSYERPPELAGIDKPILGFYGNLDWWIDWALVERLSLLERYQVVIIGDTEGEKPKVPAHLKRSSIVWIDRKPVHALPAFLDAFDVTLFPFLVNEMTNGVDPLKVWEYLAFGKPVLATRTAFIEARAELFHLVAGDAPGDVSDLDEVVAAALESARDVQAIARRRAAAAERDWRVIADELHDEIVAAISKKGLAG